MRIKVSESGFGAVKLPRLIISVVVLLSAGQASAQADVALRYSISEGEVSDQQAVAPHHSGLPTRSPFPAVRQDPGKTYPDVKTRAQDAVWSALATATKGHELTMVSVNTVRADIGFGVHVVWRGGYAALLKALDLVLIAHPELTLERLEMRRIADSSEIECRVTLKPVQAKLRSGV